MDFHQNQPDGDVNGHCLTVGWNEEYEGNQAECSWGVYDRFVKINNVQNLVEYYFIANKINNNLSST